MKILITEKQLKKIFLEDSTDPVNKIINFTLKNLGVHQSETNKSKYYSNKNILIFENYGPNLKYSIYLENYLNRSLGDRWSEKNIIDWFVNEFGEKITNIEKLPATPQDFGVADVNFEDDFDEDTLNARYNSREFQEFLSQKEREEQEKELRRIELERIRVENLEKREYAISFLKNRNFRGKICGFKADQDDETIIVKLNSSYYERYFYDGEMEMDKTHELFTFFQNILENNLGEGFDRIYFEFKLGQC